MISKNYRLIAALAVVSLAAIFVLRPQSEERVSILARDGESGAAIQLLEVMSANGDRRPHILQQLADLYDSTGNVQAAAKILLEVAEIVPRNTDVLRRLAAFFETSSDLTRQIDFLTRIAAIDPAPAEVRKLLGLLRLHGHFDAELALLKRLASLKQVPPLYATDYVRLGTIEFARGETGAAIMVLQRLEDLKIAAELSPGVRSAARTMLFDALLAGNRPEDAVHLAGRWIQSGELPPVVAVDQLLRRLAAQSPVATVTRLAEHIATALPGGSFEAAEALLQLARPDGVRGILRNWYDASSSATLIDLERFVALASDSGSLDLVLTAVSAPVSKSAPLQRMARLAEAMYNVLGPSILAPLRGQLEPIIATRPVFAASLAMLEGNPMLARHYLLNADPSTLGSGELERWADMLADLIEEPDELALPASSACWSVTLLTPRLSPLRCWQKSEPDKADLHLPILERTAHE